MRSNGRFLMKSDLVNLATKADLKGLATKDFVQNVFGAFTADMISEIDKQTRWLTRIVIAQTVAIIATMVVIALVFDT